MSGLNLSALLNQDEGGSHLPRLEMNKLIMNYLVTEGFKDAAEKFKLESGVQPSIDLDSIDDRIQIREAILNGRIEEAVRMIDQLFPELLEQNPLLFFHLQTCINHLIDKLRPQTDFDMQQHLIELIREQKIEPALEFAQTHLATRGESSPEILIQLEKTMALMAFDDPESSPFGDLLHSSQRQKVASDVNAAILDTDSKPKLETFVKLLHWSQSMLDEKKVQYSKMSDVAHGVTT